MVKLPLIKLQRPDKDLGLELPTQTLLLQDGRAIGVIFGVKPSDLATYLREQGYEVNPPGDQE